MTNIDWQEKIWEIAYAKGWDLDRDSVIKFIQTLIDASYKRGYEKGKSENT